MEYYSAIKKNEIMSFVGMWMDLEIIILSEVSQTERQMSWYCLYAEFSLLIIEMNLLTKQKQTHRMNLENDLLVSREGRIDW